MCLNKQNILLTHKLRFKKKLALLTAALCRERLLLVFLNADLAQIRGDDYAFFYEQLVFSLDQLLSAAPAA